MIFVLILIVTMWKLRRKGYCGGNIISSANQAIPYDAPTSEDRTQHGLLSSEPASQSQRPSNPTILRTASIPTYRECLDGSDRVVAENNYVTLPTDEPSPPSYDNGSLEAPPPTYEDVQEHQDLYTVAE